VARKSARKRTWKPWRPLFVYLLDQAGFRVYCKTYQLLYQLLALRRCGLQSVDLVPRQKRCSEEVLRRVGLWFFELLRYRQYGYWRSTVRSSLYQCHGPYDCEFMAEGSPVNMHVTLIGR
jgi:hypothetical protein